MSSLGKFSITQGDATGALSTPVRETSTSTTSTWYHVAAVFTSSSGRTIYKNGANNATDTTSLTGSTTANSINLGADSIAQAASWMRQLRFRECGTWRLARLTLPR